LSIALSNLPVRGAFDLKGLRKIALTVAVLAVLFSSFFWLGYWTGVGHTLIKQTGPIPAAPPLDTPKGAPVHQIEERGKPVWL
jgi:hypothetical protein